MAVARTVLAADRALLARVRTPLTLIGFGFTIHKILSTIQKAGGVTLLRAQTPRYIGIFMILVGIVPLAPSGTRSSSVGNTSEPLRRPAIPAAACSRIAVLW